MLHVGHSQDGNFENTTSLKPERESNDFTKLHCKVNIKHEIIYDVLCHLHSSTTSIFGRFLLGGKFSNIPCSLSGSPAIAGRSPLHFLHRNPAILTLEKLNASGRFPKNFELYA